MISSYHSLSTSPRWSRSTTHISQKKQRKWPTKKILPKTVVRTTRTPLRLANLTSAWFFFLTATHCTHAIIAQKSLSDFQFEISGSMSSLYVSDRFGCRHSIKPEQYLIDLEKQRTQLQKQPRFQVILHEFTIISYHDFPVIENTQWNNIVFHLTVA